jgi:DNA-binding response OmpR family regulator
MGQPEGEEAELEPAGFPIAEERQEFFSSSSTSIHQPSVTILIVEDNEDVRTYIKDQLADQYQILEAHNGKAGLDLALDTIPDLILTDVMMPEMNGVEFCRLIKTNEKTSHIPVIMLTAKAEREDKIEGLETGADDYLIKPFDVGELQVRVRNLIEQRRRLQERFGKHFSFQPDAVQVSSVDEQFLQRVKTVIEERLDDETFGVVELGAAVGMSRSQLHRKLKALTGQGPNEIIREMRLLRAKELLEKGAGNASEVAYMVGFSSPAYFSKCFGDRFGVTPSEVMV